jgi:Papain family cysteine protease
MNVDWRNRFGRNWITSVRDQGATQNCWAFAATALYEAMVRIEHCLWTCRSEGDMVHGVGKQAWDLGNIGECTIFVERYGLADPDCFPWGESAALYTAREGGAALEATPLSTTPDRAGRTARIAPGMTTSLTDPAQKRQWIDAVGPMATLITPPSDFGSLHGGIYRPTVPGSGPLHALLVIGYDDAQRYWIVKNCWGTAWGVGGFGLVSYDANILEPAAFTGLRGTNADPWSRRRLRNGTLIQGGNGGLRNNFELFVRIGANIEHWYRDNADAKLPWVRVGAVRSSDPYRDTFHDDALDCPAALQSTFNRNYELVYRTTYRQLRHVWWDQAGGLWSDATIFGPTDPVGIPGFVQSNRGAPGDFEVVVVNRAGQLEHWTKHNSAPWDRSPGEWYRQQVFGASIAFGGPALVQSRIGVPGYPENGSGELHYVCTAVGGQMQHYSRGSAGWSLLGTFGQNVTSAPCMIEGTYGAHDETGVGNFELCVAVNGQIEHWWRPNAAPGGAWSQSAVFGTAVGRVVSLIQSTYGTDLEVIAERTDGRYQHYWRDGNLAWQAGPIIT